MIVTRYVVQCFARDQAGTLVLDRRVDVWSEAEACQMAPRLVSTMIGAAALELMFDEDELIAIIILTATGDVPDAETLDDMMIAGDRTA